MFLRAAFERQATDSDPGAPIRFVASTEGVKSDGMDLRFEDWSLDRWVRHPVILFGHDFTGARALPIGLGRAEFQGRDLMIDVTFDSEDEFAQKVRAKTVKGMMGGSVSWDVVQQNGRKKNELLEFSVVPIPLDPNALPVRQLRAAQDMATHMLEVFEHAGETQGDVGVFDGVALAMRALYGADGLALGEEKRRKLFNWLERCYHALERTAPEWQDDTDLRALDAATVRGLFLENEFAADARAGAVLNARNKEKLTQAAALIGEVVASAEAAQPENGGATSNTPRSAEPVAQDATEVYAQALLARVRLMQ